MPFKSKGKASPPNDMTPSFYYPPGGGYETNPPTGNVPKNVSDFPEGVFELPGTPGLVFAPRPPEPQDSHGSPTFEECSEKINKLIRILKAFSFQERRSQLLGTELVVIESRLNDWAEWARNRDITHISTLESISARLPEATKAMVDELCRRLRIWLQWSERPPLDNLTGISLQSRTTYLEIVVEGYDTLETLRTVCGGLETLIPFLPSPGSSLEREQPAHQLQEQVSIPLSPSEGPSGRTQSANTSPERKRKKPTIQLLYVDCLDAIQAVTSQVADKKQAGIIRSRLMVWGCGIFQQENSLDLLLEEKNIESITTFRSHLIGVLADIAVILVTLLRSFDERSDPEVQKAAHKLEACFGKFKEFNEEVMDEELDLPEPNEDGQDEDPALAESCMRQLSGLVDCLFDVLPSIDRLRQAWMLKLEKRSRDMAAALSQAVPLSAPEVHHAAESDIQTGQMESRLVTAQNFQPTLHNEDLSPVAAEMWQERSQSPSSAPRPLGFVRPFGETPGLDDELDYSNKPGDTAFTSTARSPVSAISPLIQSSAGLRRQPRPSKPKTRLHQASLQEIVAMDLELATALRLSLNEEQERLAQNEDEEFAVELMAVQLKEWDQEISRLRKWSDAFENSLDSSTSEPDTDRLYSIFEQLAKISGTFAGTRGSMQPNTSTETKETVEEKLKVAASVISKMGGKTLDVKIDQTPKDYKQALSAFRQANDNIQRLGYTNDPNERFQSDVSTVVS
ncbi:hypothetical protein ACEPPN_005399 [Leptodophora sp. 'Broadleaf-Isolate-01']